MANDKDLKEIIAANLVYYRKSAKYTQSEIAERFNYSDKAISKWERGEATPDIFVLKALADFYGVELTDFFKVRHLAYVENNERKHILLTVMSIFIVWLIATILFVIFNFLVQVLNISDHAWLLWIFAIPLSSLIAMILCWCWFKTKIPVVILASIFVWSITLAIYLPLEIFTGVERLWLLLIIPIPLQALIILIYRLKNPIKKFITLQYKKIKDKSSKKENKPTE